MALSHKLLRYALAPLPPAPPQGGDEDLYFHFTNAETEAGRRRGVYRESPSVTVSRLEIQISAPGAVTWKVIFLCCFPFSD